MTAMEIMRFSSSIKLFSSFPLWTLQACLSLRYSATVLLTVPDSLKSQPYKQLRCFRLFHSTDYYYTYILSLYKPVGEYYSAGKIFKLPFLR